MTGKFELFDYEDRDKAHSNPRLVITDAGPDNNMVRLQFGDNVIVKVLGAELIKATQNCMNINYPYL